MTLVEHVHQAVSEKTITAIGNTGIFGGAGATLLAWISEQNILGWVGAGIGIGGLVLNWWHKRAIQRIERSKLDLEWQRYRDERDE